MTVDSDRTFAVGADRERVWKAFAQVDDYQRWWPWLRSFEADALAEGSVWHCAVQPPVPYRLRFTIQIDSVVECEHVAATISGDIEGTARLDLRPVGTDTEIRLVASLTPRRPVVRVVERVLPPLARYGHDWVLDTGVRQFGEEAL